MVSRISDGTIADLIAQETSALPEEAAKVARVIVPALAQAILTPIREQAEAWVTIAAVSNPESAWARGYDSAMNRIAAATLSHCDQIESTLQELDNACPE